MIGSMSKQSDALCNGRHAVDRFYQVQVIVQGGLCLNK
jgi:hypothetical protein